MDTCAEGLEKVRPHKFALHKKCKLFESLCGEFLHFLCVSSKFVRP